MTSAGGHWIRVRFADASQRLDWIPDEQPPSPDGSAGAWHVVPDPAGGDSVWEWHRGSVAGHAPATATPAAAAPAAAVPVAHALAAPAPVPVAHAAFALPPVARDVSAAAAPFIPPAVRAMLSPVPPSDLDPSITQPLPLQVVPHRARSGNPPAVFPTAAAGRARAGRPLRMGWAAASLSVVLAVPVVYLLAHDTGTDAAATTSQSDLNPNSDEAAMAGAGIPGATPDTGDTVTGSPLATPVPSTVPGAATTTSPGPIETGAPVDLGGPSATPPTEDAIRRYLAHLYNLDATQGYSFAVLGDSALRSAGNDACGGLDRGISYDSVRQSIMYRIPNGGQIVVAAAATFLCPQHHGKLQAYTAAQQSANAPSNPAATPASTPASSDATSSDVARG